MYSTWDIYATVKVGKIIPPDLGHVMRRTPARHVMVTGYHRQARGWIALAVLRGRSLAQLF